MVDDLEEQANTVFVVDPLGDFLHQVLQHLFFFLGEHAADAESQYQLRKHEMVVFLLNYPQRKIVQGLLRLQIVSFPLFPNLVKAVLHESRPLVPRAIQVGLDDLGALPTALQLNHILCYFRHVELSGDALNQVEGVFGFDEVPPVLPHYAVDILPHPPPPPLEHQLQHPAPCLLLSVLVHERPYFLVQALATFFSLLCGNIEQILDLRKLLHGRFLRVSVLFVGLFYFGFKLTYHVSKPNKYCKTS